MMSPEWHGHQKGHSIGTRTIKDAKHRKTTAAMCWILVFELTHTKSNARSSWKQLEKFLNVERWAVLVTPPTLLGCWPVVLNGCNLVLCLLVTLWTLVDVPAVSVQHGLNVLNCEALSLLATAVNLCVPPLEHAWT